MEHVVCAVCNRTLGGNPHHEPGVGFVGPECRRKVSGLLDKLDQLQLSDLLQGLTLDLQPNASGGFSPTQACRALLARAERHGLKVKGEAKPGGKITYTLNVPRTLGGNPKKCGQRMTHNWVPQ